MSTSLEYKAESIDAYLAITERLLKKWVAENDSNCHTKADLWYRGVSNVTHTLLPGFYRLPDEILEDVDEEGLRDEFERRALALLGHSRPADKWEWYFLMQHYEMPTRLLDWSEGSLVGLYFAVADYKNVRRNDNCDACVWVLNPSWLNQQSLSTVYVKRYDDPKVAGYLSDFHSSKKMPKMRQLPAAILPSHNSSRINAQRGMFTIHGYDRRPLEKAMRRHRDRQLIQIVIPCEKKKDIRAALRNAGISEVVMFPELPYLSLEICRAWELDREYPKA